MKIPFQKKQEEEIFEAQTISPKDIIAPSSITLTSDQIKLGNKIAKSFFIFSYFA